MGSKGRTCVCRRKEQAASEGLAACDNGNLADWEAGEGGSPARLVGGLNVILNKSKLWR